MDVFTPMWVYIAKCGDGTLYTGVTTDLKRRIYEHNHSPNGHHYTSKRTPVEIIYTEEYPSHAPAFRREREIKSFTRKQRLDLIQQSQQSKEVVYVGSSNALAQLSH